MPRLGHLPSTQLVLELGAGLSREGGAVITSGDRVRRR